jgi:hypothetical protein
MGNTSTTIHSVRNLQRKFNRQHRRMIKLDIWSQVFGARQEVEDTIS